ncbi:MAG: HNH endonuclease signature motif containing protein [Actinomycetota bacterium]|nr:HNH endonuclease signature motif containing protein [Actinomycetota bacterium]
MEARMVCERVRAIASLRAATDAGRAELEGGLRSVSVVRSWLAAAEAELAGRLAGVVSFPEQAIAEAGRGSQGEAGRVLERSGTLGATPRLAGALNDGSVTAGHVDAVTRVAKALEGDQRERLVQAADGLAGVAAVSSVGEFRRRLEREARTIRSDDGMARLQRQRAAIRLRRFIDDDGMWCLLGRYDPVTGVRMDARLEAEIEALFAKELPVGCPTDPVAKQQFLAALALARILEDGGVAQRAGRPEFVVVIHTTTSEPPDQPDGDTTDTTADATNPPPPPSAPPFTVEWGLPIEVPHRVLVELFGEADVHTIVVRNGVVLHAPGVLDLGRSTRLANRAKRRALRGWYSTCAIPGCQVRFDRCKIHHLHWWRHGGRTDLDNLLPLCAVHHTRVHDAGWVLTLEADRALIVRYPDGTIHNTGPPHRHAA